ncbi:hypothetical protein ES5_02144 [Dietzia cinnamea P4]|nr:hypothetical protein ES5_02144 [Dietzia cinnamea P4]
MATSVVDWVDHWLSPGRFAPYLRKAGGDRGRALALYEWNVRLSSAFLHDLSHLEIALRNAYDVALGPAVEPGESHWTDEATALKLFPIHKRLNARGKNEDINNTPRRLLSQSRKKEAERRANGCIPAGPAVCGNCPPEITCQAGSIVPGKIVAEQTFGFWAYMTSDHHEKTIWVPYLHKAYPTGHDRAKTHKSLEEVRDLRNRVAHHEPIFQRPEVHRRRILSLMRTIRPEAEQHFTQNSDVQTIIAARP